MLIVDGNNVITDLIAKTNQTDISGFVIVYAVNQSGNTWDIVDSTPGTGQDIIDISGASRTNAYFIPYTEDGYFSIGLNNNITPCTDYIEFYPITSDSMQYFTGSIVNLQEKLQYVNTNILFRIFETYIQSSSPENIISIDLTVDIPVTYTNATLPVVASYSAQKVNDAFNTNNTGSRVVDLNDSETIASEVKSYLTANNSLPFFKSYKDYIAYKKAINIQNYLLNR